MRAYLTMDEAMEQEYRDEHEYEIMFNRDSQAMKRVGRGAYNKASANGKTKGKAATIDDFMEGKKMKEIKDLFYKCKITRGDHSLLIEGKEYFDSRCSAYAKLNKKGLALKKEFFAQFE